MAKSSADKLADALDDILGVNSTQLGIQGFLDTGIPELNFIMSGKHETGIPYGRVIEIFGPSSSGKSFLSTMMMSAAQRAGGIAGFSDHERSFEPNLAATIGLDLAPSKFRYVRPQTFEESISIAMKFCEAVRERKLIPDEAPLIWVFDSVAAMIPHSKLFDDKGKRRDVGDYNMRDKLALASSCSQSYPALSQFAEDYNMTVLLLNQIRIKPGTLYGDPTCLHGKTKIPFADGTFATIKEVVEKKISKEVLSINEKTGLIEPKKIVGWHDNGEIGNTEDWIHIESIGLHCKNGRVGMTVTPDHKVMIRRDKETQWVRASEISVGDDLVTVRKSKLNGTYEQFLRAVLSGDSSIHQTNSRRNVVAVRIQDNNDPEYMRWKVEKLSKYLSFSSGVAKLKGKEYEFWTSNQDSDIRTVDRELKGNRCPIQALNVFSPLTLAVWMMDDGWLDHSRPRYTLSVKRYARSEDLSLIADRLFDLGFDFGVRRGEGCLIFTKESSVKLSEMIAPYVPPCMERKILPEHRGRYVDFALDATETLSLETSKVVEVRPLGEKARRFARGRYDITVEDNHNYMAGSRDNGVFVHNCTPGGNAAEFYASIRLSLGKKDLVADIKGADGKTSKKTIGFKITAKTVKNKVSRPLQTAEWQIRFNKGLGVTIDRIASVLDYCVRMGWVEKSGAYLTWEGKKYHQGKLETLMRNDPEGVDKLLALIVDPEEL